MGRRLTAVRYGDLRGEADAAWGDFSEFDTIDYGPELVWDDGGVLGLTWGSTFDSPAYCLELQDGGVGVGDDVLFDVSASRGWNSLVGAQVTDVRVNWIDEEDSSVELSPLTSRFALMAMRAPLLEAGMEPARRDPLAPRPRMRRRLRLQRWIGMRMLGLAARVARLRDRAPRARLVYPLSIEIGFGSRRVWVGVVQVIGVEGGEYELFQGDELSVAFDKPIARKLQLVPGEP